MAETPTPLIIVTLQGGLLHIEAKTAGCVLIVHDYDALDPDQDAEDLEERYQLGQCETDAQGDDYQVVEYHRDDTVSHTA